MSRSSLKVHAEPTLQRSLTVVKAKLEHMMLASLQQQMQRFNLPTK